MKNNNQILIAIFAVVLSLFILRLVQLQIAEHNKYDLLAVENAGKTVIEPAPRGVIYDRNGKVLVESRPVFSVRILPYVLAQKTEKERQQILARLGRLLGQKIKLKVSATEPFMVKDNIALRTAIKIEELKDELDGVVVSSRPVRLSRYGSLASHLLGYVGEIEAPELARLKMRGYKLGDIVGKDGVEKSYDKSIRGIDGGQRVEIDVHGTPLRVLESLDPVFGPDMKLTIDLEMQRELEKALGEQEGAAIVTVRDETFVLNGRVAHCTQTVGGFKIGFRLEFAQQAAQSGPAKSQPKHSPATQRPPTPSRPAHPTGAPDAAAEAARVRRLIRQRRF